MLSHPWLLRVLALVALVCTVAGCATTSDDSDETSSQLSTVADRTFYRCQTATKDKAGQRVAWEINKLNNTMDRIQIQTPTEMVFLAKVGTDHWKFSNAYYVHELKLGLKKNGQKSIETYFKEYTTGSGLKEYTGNFENGFCEVVCDSLSTKVGNSCVDVGVTPEDEFGNLAIDIAAGGFTGPVRAVLARLISRQGVYVALSRSFATSIAIQPGYVGENVVGNSLGWFVKYLSPGERQAYRIFVRNGKLFTANGELFSTATASTVHSGAGRAIFVVDEAGNIFASNFQRVGVFHHSSLVAGGKVLTAGELQVENGVLKLISNKSGHYRPPTKSTDVFLGVMREAGVNTSSVIKDLVE